MRMDLGTRNTLLYDFMHCMTAVSLEMSDEPHFFEDPYFTLTGKYTYPTQCSLKSSL